MSQLLRHLGRLGAYPLTVGAAAAATLLLRGQGVEPTLVVTGVGAASLVLVALLERWLPYRQDWRRSRGDVLTDALHLLLSIGVAGELGRRVALLGDADLALWPTSWPLLLQLLLALLVAELFIYAVHRLQHSDLPRWASFAWRIHAVHHSVGRLYFLNASRLHPIDSALTAIVSFGPLVVLGAGPELITLYTVVTGVHSALQHANLDLRLGPLNLVLSAAEAHRWHHSDDIEESRANYGQVLLVWDHVFGTWRAPRRSSLAIGMGGPPLPEGWLAQAAAPFVERHWR
jgi:sterol desaturase/sphingolipid hydroxylase (fatty acid hydroxylase superfamily)